MKLIFIPLLFLSFVSYSQMKMDSIRLNAERNAIIDFFLLQRYKTIDSLQSAEIDSLKANITDFKSIIQKYEDISAYDSMAISDCNNNLAGQEKVIEQQRKMMIKQKIKNTWRTIGYTAAGVALGLLIGIFAR